LERLLGLGREYIRGMAASAGARYSPFAKPARPRPFQKKAVRSKLRMIDNPSEELKVMQSLITERLLNQ